MYFTYYSKMRTSLDPSFNIDREIQHNRNKIVVKTLRPEDYRMNNNESNQVYRSLRVLSSRYRTLRGNYADKYITFKIPKANGKLRTIHAPVEELKDYQREFTKLFVDVLNILPHNASYAYHKKRNVLTEMQVHQAKGARWFLKVDLKDFFDHCTKDLVLQGLRNMTKINVYSVIARDLEKYLEPCLLNGALPQGAPSSPFLSNMVMFDTDLKITQALPGMLYTRYADDLLISSPTHFDFRFVVGVIESCLPEGIRINHDKTRYGNCNGSNWNLGLMYNKDLNITVGYKQKKLIKNRVHNYLQLTEEERQTDEAYNEITNIKGLLSYYKHIEPEYFTKWIEIFRGKGFPI